MAEMERRQGEYENEIENCKGETERARATVQQSAGDQKHQLE
jgi:hypothetical protein